MAGIINDFITVTPTLYGTGLQTAMKLGIPYNVLPNTTLNEKFGIQSGVMPSAGVYPRMTYIAIGNLGHYTVTAADGSDESEPARHQAEDAAAFNHIPFVLREVGDDLTPAMRARYGLRRNETHNGRNYFAYYLRRFDLGGVQVQYLNVEIINGVPVTTPFVPSANNLNPERPSIPNTGTVLGGDSCTIASAIVNFKLDAQDIEEIVNAHRIRTGSTRSPVISEIAICSGVDREVSASSGGQGTFMFNEVIAAQVNVHICTAHAIGYTADGLDFTIDIGGNEPKMGTDSINTDFLPTP